MVSTEMLTQSDTHTHRDTDRHTDRQTDTHTHRQTDTQTHRQKDVDMESVPTCLIIDKHLLIDAPWNKTTLNTEQYDPTKALLREWQEIL